MADVDAGRIGMIVVHKIDRLTRSLADFAKLVERLDAAGSSFISVTQAFNTSSSMGRLTLNVLLSLAAPNAYLLHRAPEVRATDNVGVSSDIFQVGMTLARLLLGLNHLQAIWASVGRPDYEDEIDAGRLLTAKDFPSHIPASVRRVVLKAIHPDPNKRYTSSLEMRRAIKKLNFPGH